MNRRWICPFCNSAAIITEQSFNSTVHEFFEGNKYGLLYLTSTITVCPNDECREYALAVSVTSDRIHRNKHGSAGTGTHSWQLVPSSIARPLPDYIPTPLVSDYSEACRIVTLSPKASATLSRRCLQGMIRDYWGIKKARLYDEIAALRDRVDPRTWEAIDAVRQIGNIGAHMEADINLIVDVEEDEAKLLLELIETLIDDWYVLRHQREARLSAITQAAARKHSARKPKGTEEAQSE